MPDIHTAVESTRENRHPSPVRTTFELTEHEYAERTTDPADRRRNVVTITPAGRRQLRKLDALIAGIQGELLAPLSAAERQQLVRLLTRLVDHHARH